MDYRAFYDLDSHIFGTVGERFRRDGHLSALDFFCIVTWKASRAKPRVAERLLAKGHGTLDAAVHALTAAISAAPTPKERLRIVVRDWGFRLPMASAVLTVLYPEDFTICDVRVGEIIGQRVPETHGSFDALWERYLEFHAGVEAAAPPGLSLRAKDEYLWGKSLHAQLQADLKGWEMAVAGLPEVFSVSIGGFEGPAYDAERIGDAIRYRVGLYSSEPDREIRPTTARWAGFWSACERLQVWRWAERYDEPLVLDGTSWSVELGIAGRQLQSGGANVFPGLAPGTSDTELTRAFRGFLAALRELLGGVPFS